ncbi:pyridoxal-phosphate dependent enzyme [Amycolatopsis bartoniae]|nr:pyridoxal-phosphate dependent enzyme [Amycolatopsis bartoniae]
MVRETLTLEKFPGLRQFRANLGRTPLVRVPGPPDGAAIYAKYEFHNPFGSVKDRTAYALICAAVNGWDGVSPLRLLDASGGNMARALAHLGRLMAVPVRLVVPESVPRALVDELAELGAIVDLADAERFLLGIIETSEAIHAAEPGWTLLSQHRNAANVAMHEFVTGQEIIGQLGPRTADCWVAAIGSGGTITGVSRALRTRFKDLRVVGVTPAELPYGTELPPNGAAKFPGAGGLGFGHRQPFVATELPDLPVLAVSYENSLAAMREFLDSTGVRIGASSAANWLAAKEVASTMRPEQTVVTLFADAGSRADWSAAEARR